MRDLLRGYAAATFDSAAGAGHVRQVADDISAFSRILMASEPLWNVLTDMAIPPQARRGVVHDLLEAKVARETLELVSWAALVEAPAELPAALNELEELAHVTADAFEAGRPRAIGAEESFGGRTRGPGPGPRLCGPVVPGGRAAGEHRRDRERGRQLREAHRIEPRAAPGAGRPDAAGATAPRARVRAVKGQGARRHRAAHQLSSRSRQRP